MSDAISKKAEELTNIIMLARNLVTEEKLREKYQAEDGVMRVIE